VAFKLSGVALANTPNITNLLILLLLLLLLRLRCCNSHPADHPVCVQVPAM
jgi:hypothetical protein